MSKIHNNWCQRRISFSGSVRLMLLATVKDGYFAPGIMFFVVSSHLPVSFLFLDALFVVGWILHKEERCMLTSSFQRKMQPQRTAALHPDCSFVWRECDERVSQGRHAFPAVGIAKAHSRQHSLSRARSQPLLHRWK